MIVCLPTAIFKVAQFGPISTTITHPKTTFAFKHHIHINDHDLVTRNQFNTGDIDTRLV